MALLLKKRFGLSRNKRLKKSTQLRFLQRLLRLLENGYPLIEALEMLEWDRELQNTSSVVIRSLKSGSRFDEALENVPFNSIITNYLYLVRGNNRLTTNIEKCLIIFEQRMLYTKKLRETTRYPTILLVIFAFLLYFIKQSVLPSFIDLFQNSPESTSTVMLTITIIDIIGNITILSLMMAALIFIVWRFNEKNVNIDTRIKVYNTIPVYRQYKKMETSFLFAVHLSSLLATGVSIKEILKDMAEQKKQPVLAYYASLLTDELSKGIYFTNSLTGLSLIEPRLASIFQKNADKEALERDLSMYAEFQMDDLHSKIMKLITYIQPVFFTILASLIIFIYLALMWPMFDLINTI